jgi:hypothetical protein
VKKVVGLFLVVCSLAILPAVNANEKNSIVIIDTAIDTTAKNLSGRIVHEVCVMETQRCPNGTNFMEGPGSASLPVSQVYAGGFDHGTIMASVAAQVNPNLNIVFIRIVPMTSSGMQGIYTETSARLALDWIVKNKNKFNIIAASASIGHHNFKTLSNYCPVNINTRNSIINAQNANIATFFSAGNKYDLTRVDYPSCITEAISVGATEKTNRISLYSNGGNDLDFYSLGDYTVANKRVIGSSASTVALASYWVKKYQGSYTKTYEYLKSVTQTTENTKIKSTVFVDILKYLPCNQ